MVMIVELTLSVDKIVTLKIPYFLIFSYYQYEKFNTILNLL